MPTDIHNLKCFTVLTVADGKTYVRRHELSGLPAYASRLKAGQQEPVLAWAARATPGDTLLIEDATRTVVLLCTGTAAGNDSVLHCRVTTRYKLRPR